jgi:hypothetical protein
MSPRKVHNKSSIEKCVLSFSHDKFASRAEADEVSVNKAKREIAAGKKGISHLILRAENEEIDRLKFLFPICGVPIMCYALANVLNSSLKEIAVIGSPQVRLVLDAYLENIGDQGKKIVFVDEEKDNLSLGRAMTSGRDALQPSSDELILFQPGDLPFMYDVEKVLQDNDIISHNLILWLNARNTMFPETDVNPDSEFIVRNYHYRAIDQEADLLFDIKEPNIYPINFSSVEPDIIDLLHQTRKDGKIFQALLRKTLKHPRRLMRMLSVFAQEALLFRSAAARYRPDDEYQFGMHKDRFDRGASILLDTNVTSKFHDDPAFVADVDALEDWEDYEEVGHYAEANHGEDGLSTIHPYGQALIQFKEKVMPQLKTQIPLYRDFPSYMNQLYQSLQMDRRPFDESGEYISLNSAQAKTKTAFNWYSEKTKSLLQFT